MVTALTQILTKKSYQAKRATKSILAYLFEFTPMMFTAMTLALVLFLALLLSVTLLALL